MRWILVFIFLYVIPLVVLFKNYKKFSRACIYACTYVVLATTIVISNMYISGIKQLENNNSMVMNYKEIYTSSLDVNNVEQDLLKIIDNPIQDIPLVTVLRSPIAEFTDDELVKIRLSDKHENFYECMQKAKVNVDSKLKEKIQNLQTGEIKHAEEQRKN